MRLRALSMWRPYGDEIARGRKRIECRDQWTGWRGDIAIHNSKRCAPEGAPVWDMPGGGIGPAGAIIAVASLVDCLRMRAIDSPIITDPGIVIRSDGPVSLIRHGQATSIVDQRLLGDWRVGRYGYLLDAIRPLQEPVALRGMPGIWTLTEEQTETVYAQL